MPLVIAGATSGSTTIQATDAVTATITLPTVSGTLATLAGSETLTNKALNGTLGATTPSTAVCTTIEATSTIKGATTISVGAATPSASGAGITFPATQSDSTNANTLDDYEEGTWTPNQGAGLTVVGTFSSTGYYTKIGRVVHVTGRVTGSTSVTAAASGAMLSNLPFPANTEVATGSSYNSGANIQVVIITSTLYNGWTISSATNYIIFTVTYIL